ncbi:MAG: hypothetical protein R2939_21700 [Kofleriaceae bacterium]
MAAPVARAVRHQRSRSTTCGASTRRSVTSAPTTVWASNIAP